ncbi:MAG TPA: VWA domain-containing protein, partial [Tepidiformaceae bacterium]|nr:VWA domain-containing protein [Tepidiformaceae bacterium]
MSDLTFAYPGALFAIAVVVLIFAAAILAPRRNAARVRALARATRIPAVAPALLLLALATALAVVAAGLPRWGTEERSVSRTGADLIVVLDVSRSMDATDVAPSRLAAAKTAIAATFERVNGGRVGLVIFGGSARVRLPLTTDVQAAIQVVSTLESGTVLVGAGTSASAGIAEALEALTSSGSDPSEALVLLISDGEDLGDPAAAGAAASALRNAGVDFFVAGVGTAEGSTIPIYNPRTEQFEPRLNAAGQPLVSRLDETLLRLVASAAEGRYLGTDTTDIPGAVSGRLASLEQTRFDDQAAQAPIERFQWFAAAAFILLVLGTLAERLPGFRLRSVALPASAIVALLLFAGCATQAYSANEEGRDAFSRGDYPGAIAAFLDAQVEAPDDARITLNLAAAYHANGDLDDAARSARRALQSPDVLLQAQGYASLGHHLFAAGDLPASLDAFRNALLREPADDTIRHDYEVVLALLTPDDEEPPEGDPGDGDGEPPEDPGEGDPGDP